MKKIVLAALACMVSAGGALSEEYKEAVITKVKGNRATLKVKDQEVQVVLGSASSAFDAKGRELQSTDRLLLLKVDNVVDVATSKQKNYELIREIKLVKGELTKARMEEANSPAEYKGAVIAKVTKSGGAVLKVKDQELTVMFSVNSKAFDIDGKPIPDDYHRSILKEGNEVDVKTYKIGPGIIIDEIHLKKGELTKPNAKGVDPGPNKGSFAPKVVTIKQPKALWDKGYYKEAKVGDYVEYQDGPGTGFLRREIVEVGDHFVVEMKTASAGGPKVQTSIKMNFTGRGDLESPPDDSQAKKSYEEKMKIGNEELVTKVVETYDKATNRLLTKQWFAKEIPFDGLVKEETKKGNWVKMLTGYARWK